MRLPLPLPLGKRLATLIATVLVAPTVAYTVFRALGGTSGQSVPELAWSYAVRTYWHLDLGVSSVYREPVWEVWRGACPPTSPWWPAGWRPGSRSAWPGGSWSRAGRGPPRPASCTG